MIALCDVREVTYRWTCDHFTTVLASLIVAAAGFLTFGDTWTTYGAGVVLVVAAFVLTALVERRANRDARKALAVLRAMEEREGRHALRADRRVTS